MIRALRWRAAALVIGFKDATAYRFEFLAEILGSALVPAAIQLVFWYALFEVGGVERAGGLDHRAAVQYTILSVLFSQVRGGDHDFDLAEMIRTGQLSAFLLRPVGVVEFTWLRGVAPKLLIAGLCFLLGLALSPLVGARVAGMVLGMGFALLGNLVHYLLGAALASVSFYWEEAYSLLMVKNLVVSILSGELLPLSFFPGAMAWIWKSLPFYLYVYAPVQFASGRWGVAEFLPQLGIALGWLLVATLLVRVSWRVGIRRYQSLGG